MTNDIDDRLSRRFDDESEPEDQSESESQQSESDMSSSTSETSQKAQNIKKEWNVRSFYLPDDLDSQLTTTYKRLDLDLAETDADIDLKKTRHYYPLVVALGLERLESMEVTEITEHIEGMDFL